ncbi:hypothetical protein K9L05_03930 [Candidatus Babeliales bacterium]|nr:hypothetical protein [Candidatus Babeliales bacterium]MCF7899766.1 hypothetical protein [Candidatus Babeliales bacterium]
MKKYFLKITIFLLTIFIIKPAFLMQIRPPQTNTSCPEILQFKNNQFLNNCTLLEVMQKFVKHLSLINCPNVTSACIPQIAKICSNLETLIISGCCSEITDAEMARLILDFPKLKNLIIKSCPNITLSNIHILKTRHFNLERIELGNCAQILTEAGPRTYLFYVNDISENKVIFNHSELPDCFIETIEDIILENN